ncbi:hypothetical protein Q5H91_04735 [Sphingomonas sp. KR1UV-12]|uniref:Uncharacterized protein n=1 Tax=Sphingomonas aurea TaxID=3063994 RepID=A0ABT9EHR9_9SPHN|nr:hypothetical protein [Sphingomonas sp. KR1UV-12]MDP1026508.1 hypothetical protein [Sphingomonas sp. KR1UV-12]
MRTSNRALLAAALGALVIGGAGLAQDRPESILPPGFGEPAPAPRATATPTVPRPGGTATPRPLATPDATGAVVQPLPTDTPSPLPTPSATPSPVDPATLAAYEMPASARRSLSDVGVGRGIAPDAFGRADGIYVEQLMRRMAAPLPSRWLSIALRRALVGQLDTPRHLNGADFAAERAWLLLRMGESVAARAVVQQVDNGNYTPKLYQVALNAMLAAGDPAGLCPLADAGLATTGEGAWALARPVCTALAGDGAAARAAFAAVRRRRVGTGFDQHLAEKVMGAAGQGRQAVTIEWTDADRLTPWRFGLATATGVAIPDDFYTAVGPQVRSWQALSPSVPVKDRVAIAEQAAAQGVFSNIALVDLYGAVAMADDAPAAAASTAADLRTAYTDPDPAARLTALRQIWGNDPGYGRLILTARAAVRQPAGPNNADADRLIAAMLSAGLDRTAQRWAGVVPAGGQAWALLALSDPDGGRRYAASDVDGYGGGAVRQRLLFAGLAGLGRMPQIEVERAAESLGVPIGRQDSWTRALDRAVADEQPGTVLLLAGIGMQTGAWRGVPPAALFRIVAALRAVGLEGEARMIAAEAVARA